MRLKGSLELKNMDELPTPSIEEIFRLDVRVSPPIVVGQDEVHGRRQLIPIVEGVASGRLNGRILPGGVDSQIIRPDGFTELVARYALELEDGERVYVNNAGIRRVDDPRMAALAAAGQVVDPEYVYFAAIPTFETYSEKYRWLEQSLFFSYGVRFPDRVVLRFYQIR